MADETTVSGCGCLDEINAMLKAGGHCLNSTILGTPDKPLINLIRLDTWKPETRRSRPSTFMPSFCPFCGLAYAAPAAERDPAGRNVITLVEERAP